MPYQPGWFREPTDLMEHILECRWYYQDDEAKEKLYLVAEHIDNPQKLKELEEEWLYGPRWKKLSSSNRAEPGTNPDQKHWWDHWWKD